MMEVGKRPCTLILVLLIFVNHFLKIKGQGLFFADFLKFIDDKYPIFITTDEFDQDLAIANENSTTHVIRYNTYIDEEQIADHLQKLHLSGDLTTIVFIDGGHQKLLDLLTNNLQLFNKGLTGLIAEVDVSSGLNLTLRLDTRLYQYSSQGNTTSLKEVYAVNGKIKVQTVGKWQENTGLTVPITNMWERRTNLEGMLIRVATMSYPGLHELHYDLSGKSITSGSGLFLEPLNILAKEINFTLKLAPSNDGKWGGTLTENGTWNGLIGMLIEEQADIAGALFVTEARGKVVSFSRAISEEIVTLMSASNGEPDANPFIYFEIMPQNAWYVLCVMVTSISTCFVIINYSGMNNMHDKFDSEKFTMINGLGLSLTFFRQIYYDVNIICKSTRILFFMSALSTYLLYIHYTAYLTAASTYSTKSNINSFRDVLSGGYQVAVFENTAQHDVLKYAKPGTAMHEVYHNTMKNRHAAFVQPNTHVPNILASKKTLLYAGDLTAKLIYKDLNVFNIQGFFI